jgi:hypothetical protein
MLTQNKILITFLITLNIIIFTSSSYSDDDKERVKKVDSAYVFKPSTAIKIYDPDDRHLSGAHGFEIAFSNSGLGFGYFYQHFIDNNNILFGSFYISGARNSDEYEIYDYETGQYIVPNKINRLFLIPLTFGYTRILFSNSISGSFRPFASIGLGPSVILSNPYNVDWFKAWDYHKSYVRFGTFAEIGAYFRSSGQSVSSVGLKFYYIPFGSPGLESIIDSPIKDFGGIVLSLTVGFGF